MVAEPLKGATAAGPGEESQLSRADDLERPVADFKLAPGAAVVSASAEAEVGSPTADKVRDQTVPRTVQDPTIAEISTPRQDQQGAGRRPRLFKEGGLRDGNDGIVGREETAKRINAMPDRLNGGSGTWAGGLNF